MRKRELIPAGNVALVPLAKGRGFAVVDIGDAAEAGRHNWSLKRCKQTSYAYTNVRSEGGKFRTLTLHQVVLGHPWVDHIDGDGLNCRRSNLRPATPSQNGKNQRKRRGSYTSRFKGVYRRVYPRAPGWRAQLKTDGGVVYLGAFPTEELAALAYNQAAAQHHGEFAKLNEV